MNKGNITATIFCLLSVICSCTVKPPEITVTGEKTVLERQLLGQYQLSPKEIFLPEADGGIYAAYQTSIPESLTTIGPSSIEVDTGRREYMIALANHRFNLDDLNRFKDQGVIGENNQGFVSLFPEKAALLTDADRAIINAVVKEENQGRQVIMRRVISLRADLTENDLPEIQRIFATRNIEEEKPGRMIQAGNGEWLVKQ